MTGPSLGPASAAIVSEIRRNGPIDYETFMSLALYEPPHGYYHNHMPGRDSDYETSPTISPWFGKLICRKLEEIWNASGRPEAFSVVEVGAGDASLADSASEAAREGFRDALQWWFVEPFPIIRAAQQTRMKDSAIATRWFGSLEEVRCQDGIVVANEVLDNFPVRLFEAGDPLKEIHIDERDGALIEVAIEVADEETVSACEVPLQLLEEGDRFEINFHMLQWCHPASAAIARGGMLIIDYGDVEPHIYTQRPSGTMVTYREQMLGTDPLLDPGTRDITTHVNFSALQRAARQAGFQPTAPVRQRDFLNGLGIRDVVEDLRAVEQKGEPASALAAMAERGRLGLLTGQGGLGDLLVLEAFKQGETSR